MIYITVIAALIILDLFTKEIAVRKLKQEEKIQTKIPGLFLWHKKNYGISYSKLNKYPCQVLKLTFVLNLLWAAAFLILLPLKGYKLLKWGFALILSGGLGNLVDRIRHKCVTDFIYIKGKHAPIFNVADVCIALGALLSLAASLKTKN